jgi:two-component system sensor histidine kinase CpxA
MRSILFKIVLWSLVTCALSLLAYRGISRATERPGPHGNDPFWRMSVMIEDEVCRAYEEGGPVKLDAELKRLDACLPGVHILTDSSGRDLVTGEDRSALLHCGRPHSESPRLEDGRLVMIPPPRGGPYRFITLVEPWNQPPNNLPYYAAIVLVIAGMGSILAVHLAAPLRRLRFVVEQFGRGELTARARSTRQDEIGELSRAFDDMADRIETLRSAERRLLQDVSHELRSPLARLGFAVELAHEEDEREMALARMRKEVGRISALVGELLQLTRIEGDPAAGRVEEVALLQVIDDVVSDCDMEAAARGCRLVFRSVAPAIISGDPELLHRAFENIVRNAIRHAPEGTAVDIALDVRGELAVASVRDYGSGVPDQFLADIFKPFFRVEEDRSRSSGGVGLGLAIAGRAVDIHHGQIRAENAWPGLIVTIVLPGASLERAAPAAESLAEI